MKQPEQTLIEIEDVRSRPIRIVLANGAVLDLALGVSAVYQLPNGHYSVHTQSHIHIVNPARKSLSLVEKDHV